MAYLGYQASEAYGISYKVGGISLFTHFARDSTFVLVDNMNTSYIFVLIIFILSLFYTAA